MPRLLVEELAKLTSQDVQIFYTRKLEEGASAYTVGMCHKVLRQALNDVLRLELVYRNVSVLVKPPRSQSPEMEFYTKEQARTLLDAASGDPKPWLY